ncbi:MAG TPA: AraC family transcriptional regulator [Kofleriaceae bacterium]
MSESLGDEGRAILERAGIASDLPPDGLLAFEAGVTVLEEAARISRRDDVGVRFARQLPWADLGVLGYVLLNAPTVGAAIAHLRRYFAIQQTAGVFSLEVDGATAHVRYALRLPPHDPARQHALAILTMLVRLVRDGVRDPAWAPDEVTLPHAPPAQASDELGFFGAPIRYGAEVASLGFPAEVLRRAMVSADPGLFPILVRHADECLAKLPPLEDDTLGEVRRLVASMLGNTTITIEDVAARMTTSVRTVQRQLQEHGQSFKHLVDDVRATMAQRHVADPAVTMTEAAFLLGYSDLSSFSRAFRRWTGQSAQAYRRAHAT